MRRGYVYKKPVKRSQYSNFRRQLFITVFFLILIAGVAYYVYAGLRGNKPTSAVSGVENIQITDNKKTFIDNYFEFQDTEQWTLARTLSNDHKRVYQKYQKNVLQHEMIVYVDQVPIPLYLAAPRVLPVRIVNNNSFQITNVSGPCVGSYAKDQPHHEMEISVSNTTILCDPDSPQYFVVLGEINGNYQLKLKRPNGTPVQFVITYKDDGLSPEPDSLLNIAGSFKTI